jgi:hypothetical protein
MTAHGGPRHQNPFIQMIVPDGIAIGMIGGQQMLGTAHGQPVGGGAADVQSGKAAAYFYVGDRTLTDLLTEIEGRVGTLEASGGGGAGADLDGGSPIDRT